MRLVPTLLVVVLGAVVLRSIALGVFVIPSRSMEPALLAGDVVLVSKLSYWLAPPPTIPLTDVVLQRRPRLQWHAPQHGDIIVFRFAYHAQFPSEPEYFVKRIVGLPGDTLWVVDDSVFRVPHRISRRRGRLYTGKVVVPKQGMSITLDRTTLRYWQPFIEREGHQVELVRGLIVIDGQSRSSYIFEQNYYYVLGDNRAASFDSRFWGFVAESDIIGTPVIVLWSRSPVLGHMRWNRLGVEPR